ncbi:hypothetical protein [Paenibacillus pasadenensis]|uniref:hypothetical protein n=1 Tax=Paenibacillus pasadenensis TaxID=217090 RepID=UPI000C79887D|nr:hypothetical protein [Paenibacillus pasadenensis]
MKKNKIVNVRSAIYMTAMSQNPEFYAVSVTQVEDLGYVLRMGAKLSRLPLHREIDLLLLDSRGYSASSSAGHVTLDATREVQTIEIVGMCGFGSSQCLRPVHPFTAYALTGAEVTGVETHSNSNTASTDAAVTYLRDEIAYSYGEEREVLILWGQSDRTQACKAVSEERDGVTLQAPEEHQTHIVNPTTVRAVTVRAELYGQYYVHWHRWEEQIPSDKKHRLVIQDAEAKIQEGVEVNVHRLIAEGAKKALEKWEAENVEN